MSLTNVSLMGFPVTLCLSTDLNLSGSMVIGELSLGKNIYTTDTQKWYVVIDASGSTKTIAPFVMPKLQS